MKDINITQEDLDYMTRVSPNLINVKLKSNIGHTTMLIIQLH